MKANPLRWLEKRLGVQLILVFEILVIIMVLAMAEPVPISLCLGATISAIGLGFRVWSRGYQLTPGERAVYGPYRFVRHPVHLGTFLILLGLCLAGRSFYSVAVMLLGSIFLFRQTFAEEEAISGGNKGVLYKDYRLRVPTFVPNIYPYSGALCRNKDFSLSYSMLKGHRRELDSLVALVFVYMLLFGVTLVPETDIAQLILSGGIAVYCGIRIALQRRQSNLRKTGA